MMLVIHVHKFIMVDLQPARMLSACACYHHSTYSMIGHFLSHDRVSKLFSTSSDIDLYRTSFP